MTDNEMAIIIGAMVGGMPYDEAYKLEGDALLRAAKEWGTKAVNVSRFLWTICRKCNRPWLRARSSPATPGTT